MSAARIAMLAALLLGASATAARADDAAPRSRLPLHVEAAITIAGGEDTASVAFRGYLGGSLETPGTIGRWRPFVGGGLHLGSGVLSIEDPRALDGTVGLTYTTLGPELRAGLIFVDGGLVDSQLYLAAAPLRVGVDQRLMHDAVDGVIGGGGLRLAAGVTFADQWFSAAFANDVNVWSWMAVLVPVTFEVTFERSAGFDRGGISFGWGF